MIGEGRATTRVASTTHLHWALSRLRSPPSRGSARTGQALRRWIPAFAGKTVGCGGMTSGGDGPLPRPCPGFPISRERRWGSGGAVGGGGAPPFRTSGFLPSQERREGGRPFEFPPGERASPPLWIPAFAGKTMGVCGERRVKVWAVRRVGRRGWGCRLGLRW